MTAAEHELLLYIARIVEELLARDGTYGAAIVRLKTLMLATDLPHQPMTSPKGANDDR